MGCFAQSLSSNFIHNSSARIQSDLQIVLARICLSDCVLRERLVMSKRSSEAAENAAGMVLRMARQNGRLNFI